MFTDDPQFLVVGAERAKRALRAERRLVDSIGLLMAIPEKRSLGSWSKWLGVLLVAGLGILVVPPDKLMRARAAIATVLRNEAEFHIYRSLCGLLEHLRAVFWSISAPSWCEGATSCMAYTALTVQRASQSMDHQRESPVTFS